VHGRPAAADIGIKEGVMARWIGGSLACAAGLAALGVVMSGTPASAATVVPSGVAMARANVFDTEVDLQGLYDEISQVGVPAMTATDVTLFHEDFYTPDWVFVDAAGQKQTWAQVEKRVLGEPAPDSMVQRIQHLSLDPDGATVVVAVTTIRTIVDTGGRYGRAGATHTLTKNAEYRDDWVKVGDEWKLKSRVQMGQATTSVDRPEWRM
jgi:hypothetical protein